MLTSATLELGGSFDAVAGTIGLRGEGAPHVARARRRQPVRLPGAGHRLRRPAPAAARARRPRHRDPRRDRGAGPGGRRPHARACSRRCARPRRPPRRCASGSPTEGEIAFLCQGEDQISTLVRQFARDPRTCLFGTLSLWQGVDVPGSSCQLVIIDRIPFPRPDDPLASARSQAIAPDGRQRLHGGLGHPRGAAAGPGRRSADPARPTTAAWSRSSTTG